MKLESLEADSQRNKKGENTNPFLKTETHCEKEDMNNILNVGKRFDLSNAKTVCQLIVHHLAK